MCRLKRLVLLQELTRNGEAEIGPQQQCRSETRCCKLLVRRFRSQNGLSRNGYGLPPPPPPPPPSLP
eukprot:1946530-Pyramimonas_sp.AAC.1